LEALVKRNDGVRLLKIDMSKDGWSAPVGRQHEITSLPTLWLYDGADRVSSDSREVWSRLQQ